MEFKILEEMFAGETPKSVFEIGCANGGLLADLVKQYPGLKVGGMEISKSIEGARQTFPKGQFITQDLNDPWPLADKSYDIVFSVGVLMYMFDAANVLKEMIRVGKTVIIAEYHHQELDRFGHLTKGYWENNKVNVGIIRNYIDTFRDAGAMGQITGQHSFTGKSILKYKSQ